MFIHHESIAAKTASESGGAGHFDVIETNDGFLVYEEGYCYGSYETLAEAVAVAEREADSYDKRS